MLAGLRDVLHRRALRFHHAAHRFGGAGVLLGNRRDRFDVVYERGDLRLLLVGGGDDGGDRAAAPLNLQPDATTKILKNIYTYLQPGGKLIISTPNKNSLWPVIELMLDTLGLTPKMKNEQHVQLYTKKTLRTVLLQHGFKVNLIESSHFLAPWLSFFGLKAAEKIHSLEQKIKIFPGSLLFAIVEKE